MAFFISPADTQLECQNYYLKNDNYNSRLTKCLNCFLETNIQKKNNLNLGVAIYLK